MTKINVDSHGQAKIENTLDDMMVEIKRSNNLNAAVEIVHIQLMEDPLYRDYLTAIYDVQAIEGSLIDDEVMAGLMIRDRAKKLNIAKIGDEKLAIIRKALRAILRRYCMSRKERREAQ